MEPVKFSEILKQNSLFREKMKDIKSYRIKILSNITCNQFAEVFSYILYTENINPLIKIGNYDNIIQESFFCNEDDLVFVHYELVNILGKHNIFVENFSEKEIELLINTIKSEIDTILSNLSSIPSVIFNTFSSEGIYSSSILPLKCKKIAESLNAHLYSIQMSNLHILNINEIIYRIGINRSFDYRMYYLSKALYTIDFWKEYSNNAMPLILKNTGKTKKAVIFDCDNTLWKGILGEDGESGIDMSPQSKIGQIYNYVQKIAVWMSSKGIIVGLCSKNNKLDIDKIIRNHPEIVLKEDYLVISRINWNDKASNLREIAGELNIGLDSILFVDDSSFEINLIKEQLPMICTFQVPAAIHEYPKQLLDTINKYFYLSGLNADLDKTEQYKAQKIRTEEKNKFNSIDEYLSSIGLEISFKENDVSEIERISQLTQKTNQFNLTTKRYTEVQIESFMKDSSKKVYSFSVRDKFGDSGLTAVCIINFNEIATVDTFLMSCRIMGRNIEKAIMDVIIKECDNRKFNRVSAKYLKTEKNTPVCKLYEEFGFTLLSDDNGNKTYELYTKNYNYNNINYIKIKL